jgi:hypothetical protein
MAKRFTDTNKYKDPFIRGLQGPYKLLWDYLYHDCDHSGIWIVDFEVAQVYLGNDMAVNKTDALKFFNDEKTRIVEFDNGRKWFIPKFIEIQYGELNEANRVHASVLNELKKHKGLISSLNGAKDKDKDKDVDEDKDTLELFETFWELYHKETKKPKTDKDDAIKKWNKLTKKERQLAIDKVADYAKTNKPDFLKKARTYLGDKNFNDEMKPESFDKQAVDDYIKKHTA